MKKSYLLALFFIYPYLIGNDVTNYFRCNTDLDLDQIQSVQKMPPSQYPPVVILIGIQEAYKAHLENCSLIAQRIDRGGGEFYQYFYKDKKYYTPNGSLFYFLKRKTTKKRTIEEANPY